MRMPPPPACWLLPPSETCRNVALTGPHPTFRLEPGPPGGGLLVNQVAARRAVLGCWLWCEMAPGWGCVCLWCPCGLSRADRHFLRGWQFHGSHPRAPRRRWSKISWFVYAVSQVDREDIVRCHSAPQSSTLPLPWVVPHCFQPGGKTNEFLGSKVVKQSIYQNRLN